MKLTNNFHRTACETRLTESGLEKVEAVLMTGRGEELRRAQATRRRIWKKLCGIDGCKCGDTFGRR